MNEPELAQGSCTSGSIWVTIYISANCILNFPNYSTMLEGMKGCSSCNMSIHVMPVSAPLVISHAKSMQHSTLSRQIKASRTQGTRISNKNRIRFLKRAIFLPRSQKAALKRSCVAKMLPFLMD